MKKNLGSVLALYPMPLTVIGAMDGGKSYTPQQMEKTIIKLLEQWQRRRQRDQAR